MCPIVGLTDRPRRLPRLGKIRLGIKVTKKDDKGQPVLNKDGEPITYPRAVDYFVCPPEVAAALGWQGKPEDFKPKELPVMLPMDDEEFWAATYYRRYSRSRGLVCKGNGETSRRMIDKATGGIADRNTKTGDAVWAEGCECKGKFCPDYTAKPHLCQEVMNLQFLMPDVPGLGVWQVDTGSINSILNIMAAAAMLRVMFKRVWGIPLLLTLEPKEVTNPDDGKKKAVQVLNLRIKGTLRETNEMIAGKSALLLPAPAPEPDEAEPPMDDGEEEAEPVKATTAPPAKRARAPVKQSPVENLWPEEGQSGKAASQTEKSSQAGTPPGEKSAPAKETKVKAPAECPINESWLTETLEAIKWSDTTLKSWIKSQKWGTTIDAPLVNVLASLSVDQLTVVKDKLTEMREAAGLPKESVSK